MQCFSSFLVIHVSVYIYDSENTSNSAQAFLILVFAQKYALRVLVEPYALLGITLRSTVQKARVLNPGLSLQPQFSVSK